MSGVRGVRRGTSKQRCPLSPDSLLWARKSAQCIHTVTRPRKRNWRSWLVFYSGDTKHEPGLIICTLFDHQKKRRGSLTDPVCGRGRDSFNFKAGSASNWLSGIKIAKPTTDREAVCPRNAIKDPSVSMSQDSKSFDSGLQTVIINDGKKECVSIVDSLNHFLAANAQHSKTT